MRLLEIVTELALCKKRLKQRTEEVGKLDSNSLKHDILLMEIEILRMLIDNLQGMLNKHMQLKINRKTRKAVFAIKPTIN
ncbi:hypothetical protein Q0590_11655 [Rhodocytophaga aerolata]|uniref:Four helix bundle protein n=1 Tax=Rhodocytophaga aerolata TaxID=455078 RepID=A0ABT8R4P5_9BACT|nr:hypothetical protein [Rhodocytophaga aerolata]MDO1446914.1 hypothetical protein [Rhodocytophaga aerolata]